MAKKAVLRRPVRPGRSFSALVKAYDDKAKTIPTDLGPYTVEGEGGAAAKTGVAGQILVSETRENTAAWQEPYHTITVWLTDAAGYRIDLLDVRIPVQR